MPYDLIIDELPDHLQKIFFGQNCDAVEYSKVPPWSWLHQKQQTSDKKQIK